MATTLNDLLESQEETNLRLDEIDNRFLEFFAMLRADKLDMLEIMSELKDQRPAVPAVPPASVTPEGDGGGMGLPAFGFASLVTGLGVALTASWAAYIKGIKDLFKTLGTSVSKAFRGLGRFVVKYMPDKIMKSIRGFVAGISMQFDILKDSFKNSKFGTAIQNGITRVRSFITSIGEFFTSIGTKMSGFGGGFREKMKPIIDYIGKFKPLFEKVFSIFRALGRIFLPLTAMIEVGMGIFREVSALEEGAGFMDYIEAGIKGIIKGLGRLVTMPLDLLKDGISWIAGKLGFDQVEGMLDKFSFTELFDKMVDGVAEIVKKIFMFPVAVAAGGKAAVLAIAPGGESPIEAFGRAFSETMSSGDAPAEGKVTATATSASVSEPPPEEASKPRTRADVRRQRMEAQAAEEAGEKASVTVINNTNAPTTTTNNTTTGGGDAPLPPPVTSNGSRSDAYAGA